MAKTIGAFLKHFLLIIVHGKKIDSLCLEVEISVLLDNARYLDNVEDASDVNRLALSGPSVWREQVDIQQWTRRHATSFPAPLSEPQISQY